MPAGCITVGPKSVVRTMDAASLRHVPLTISHHFHGCASLSGAISSTRALLFTFLLYKTMTSEALHTGVVIVSGQSPGRTEKGFETRFRYCEREVFNNYLS